MVGLQQEYREDPLVRHWIRRILALPLAPLACFVDGSAANAVREAIPEGVNPEKIDQIMTYLNDQWLDLIDSNFAPMLWSHYESDRVRTINAVEGWHRIVNTFFNKPHPNFYKFLDILKSQQHKVSIRVTQLNQGGPNNRRCSKYRRIDEGITRLKERFANGDLDIRRYLDGIGHLLQW